MTIRCADVGSSSSIDDGQTSGDSSPELRSSERSRGGSILNLFNRGLHDIGYGVDERVPLLLPSATGPVCMCGQRASG
jgi:hypothetical protein